MSFFGFVKFRNSETINIYTSPQVLNEYLNNYLELNMRDHHILNLYKLTKMGV